MDNMHQTNKHFFQIIFVVMAISCVITTLACRNDNIDDDAVALIGDRKISKEDFVNRYRDVKHRIGEGIPDTYQARRQILQNYVDEEILIAESISREYDRDRLGLLERRRIEIQELLKAYTRKFIAPKVNVTDAELKRLFISLNTKIKARHLYAPTKTGADSLYQLLQRGSTFEDLAKDVFTDPFLRESGGLLGDFAFEEMEADFEEAAFGMQVGEISKPVRTSDGYSIIMVDDRATKPLLTETEYAKHRGKLYAFSQNRKLKKAIQAFSDSLGEALEITFNKPILKELVTQFQDQPLEVKKGRFFLSETSAVANQVLAESRLGVWTVREFQERARYTSPEQRKRIKNEDDFCEFLSGLIVRQAILEKAKKAGLDRSGQFSTKVRSDFDLFLLSRMEELIRDEIAVPEDSLQGYYKRNMDRFAASPQVRLREIVLSDHDVAEKIARQLKNGETFFDLAKTHSERKWSAIKGGDLGYLQPADLGKWSAHIFQMEIGEIAGPLKMQSKLVFLKCLDKIPSKRRSFEEARSDVETTVRYLLWKDYRRTRIVEFRDDIEPVVVLPEKLKTMRIN